MIMKGKKKPKFTWVDPVGVWRCYRSKDCDALNDNIAVIYVVQNQEVSEFDWKFWNEKQTKLKETNKISRD